MFGFGVKTCLFILFGDKMVMVIICGDSYAVRIWYNFMVVIYRCCLYMVVIAW